jgi:hypothetical protein
LRKIARKQKRNLPLTSCQARHLGNSLTSLSIQYCGKTESPGEREEHNFAEFYAIALLKGGPRTLKSQIPRRKTGQIFQSKVAQSN